MLAILQLKPIPNRCCEDFWSFSPSSRRRHGSGCEISSRHQQTEAPRFIGIYHTMSCSFKGAVQFSTWRTTWLSFQRNKLQYIYILHGNGMMYVIEGKIDYMFYSLPPHLHPFHFQSLTDHMPKIHFIANKATQRQQGRSEESAMEGKWEGVLLVWFIASFLWLFICLASCID